MKDIVFWNEVYVPVSNTCLSELIPHSSTLIGRKNCQKRNCAAAANSLLNSDEEDDEIDYKHHLSQSKLDFTRSLEDIAKECVGVVAGGSAGGGGGKELSNEYDSNILKTNLFKTSSLSNLLQLNCDSPLNGKLPTEQVMASGEHEPTKLSDCNGDFDRRHEEEEEEETTQGLQSNTDNRKEVNEHNGNDSIGDCDDDDNGSGSSTDELEQQPDCKPLFDRNQNELYDIDGLLIQNGNLPDSQNQIKQRIVYHKVCFHFFLIEKSLISLSTPLPLANDQSTGCTFEEYQKNLITSRLCPPPPPPQKKHSQCLTQCDTPRKH